MRDLLISAIIFGSIPLILRNPFIGLLMWVWVGIMNPHRLAFGFAYHMPFAQIIAICTFLSMLINRNKVYRFPVDRVSILLFCFVIWLGISPLFSFHPDKEFEMWLKPFKILFMTLIAFLLVREREQLDKLAWVLALSVGFFGIKGGIFTFVSGGNNRVWGPSGSFIEDNNALALATIMIIPLLRYLQLQVRTVWLRHGCGLAIILCLVSAIGSYSRGALLAIIAMATMLFIKSRKKVLLLLTGVVLVPVVLGLMPEHWWARMASIGAYEQDGSALGRINAWHMAWNLAVDRFPIGGGFSLVEPDVFQRYAPDPTSLLVAHSIYFQILGEHGFMGLGFFLAIFILSWRNASSVIAISNTRRDLEWARDLARMCQVSLLAYAVGGAFLSLTYFDLPYYLVLILVVLRQIVESEVARSAIQNKVVLV
jgi:putative inorganic carbon (hco3(-)) transporter